MLLIIPVLIDQNYVYISRNRNDYYYFGSYDEDLTSFLTEEIESMNLTELYDSSFYYEFDSIDEMYEIYSILPLKDFFLKGERDFITIDYIFNIKSYPAGCELTFINYSDEYIQSHQYSETQEDLYRLIFMNEIREVIFETYEAELYLNLTNSAFESNYSNFIFSEFFNFTQTEMEFNVSLMAVIIDIEYSFFCGSLCGLYWTKKIWFLFDMDNSLIASFHLFNCCNVS